MFALIRQALREFVKERDRLAAIRELSKLSDQMLLDIGLRREQLPTLMMDMSSEEDQALSPGPAYRPELITCG